MMTKGYFEIVTRNENSPEHTLLLIGTATDGPTRVPFRLKDSAFPQGVLGDSPLFHAYSAAVRSGAEDIILYRLNGVHASSELTGEVYDPTEGAFREIPVMRIRSLGANTHYNNIKMVISPRSIVVYDWYGEPQKTYSLEEYRTVKALVDAINIDAEYGLIQFEAEALQYDFNSGELARFNGIVELTGGDAELHLMEDRDTHVEELNHRLLESLYGQSTYDQASFIINSDLGMLDFGTISVAGVYHNDGVGLNESLGRFCLQKANEFGQGCLGVIGVKPIDDPTPEQIAAQAEELIVMKRQTSMVPSGGVSGLNAVDVEKEATWESHLQVVVGESLTFSANGMDFVRTPLAYSYAGLQSKQPVQTSMTNKELKGIEHLSYEYDKESIDNLFANGYISIVRSTRKGFVPYAETTYLGGRHAQLNSPSAIRLSHYVSRRLTAMLDYAIGSRITPMTKREMMVQTNELVAQLLTPAVAKSYTLGFVTSPDHEGRLSVQLEIAPHTEVKTLTSIVKLPFVQGGI